MNIERYTATMADVGGIPVARLLPKGKRRTIGAWCFLDHVGPIDFETEAAGLQVGAHPHTNLQTFTWMLEGEVWHRDSLGSRQLIRPRQVNLMTAGTGHTHGIAHTEQMVAGMKSLHAVQLWIALPMNQDIVPHFEHYPELPQWHDGGVDYVLTTGSFAGHTAPTTQYSPLVGVDMRFIQTQSVTMKAQAGWEYGVLVISGRVSINGQSFTANELAFVEPCETLWTLSAEAGSHMMLLGGEPLPHPTLIWWNFIADSRDALQQAVDDWNHGRQRFGEEIDLSGTGLTRLAAPEVPPRMR